LKTSLLYSGHSLASEVQRSYNRVNVGTHCVPEMMDKTWQIWLTVSAKVRFDCHWHD